MWKAGLEGSLGNVERSRADVWNGAGISIDKVELRSCSHEIINVLTDDNHFVSIL